MIGASRSGIRTGGICLAGLLVVACAAGPAPNAAAPTQLEAPPWQMPRNEYPSQRLFRVAVAGKQGGGSARVTLRYWVPGEYEARAADALGRPLWLLSVYRGRELVIDFRAQTYCDGQDSMRLPLIDFGPLPDDALPRLLIGRLPLPPDTRTAYVWKRNGSFQFTDAMGRKWRGQLRGGWPVHWVVGDPEPLIWWRRSESGGILSRRGGGQIRWRQEVREAFAPSGRSAHPQLVPPAGFDKVSCDEPALP